MSTPPTQRIVQKEEIYGYKRGVITKGDTSLPQNAQCDAPKQSVTPEIEIKFEPQQFGRRDDRRNFQLHEPSDLQEFQIDDTLQLVDVLTEETKESVGTVVSAQEEKESALRMDTNPLLMNAYDDDDDDEATFNDKYVDIDHFVLVHNSFAFYQFMLEQTGGNAEDFWQAQCDPNVDAFTLLDINEQRLDELERSHNDTDGLKSIFMCCCCAKYNLCAYSHIQR